MNCYNIYDWVKSVEASSKGGDDMWPLWKRWVLFPAWTFDFLTLALLFESAMLIARKVTENKEEATDDNIWFRYVTFSKWWIISGFKRDYFFPGQITEGI